MQNEALLLDNFTSFTIGILVFFAGMLLNRRVAVLRNFNIPEPVTGGIIASLAALVLYAVFHIEITYTLEIRDVLLVYFFTTIGLNARFSDLIAGGKPLLILLVVTLLYIAFQDAIGVAVAHMLGLPKAMGILTGSAALIGGHGTAIAWAPEIAENHGVTNALEVGVAAATLGLVMASLLGGPIAKYLLNRHQLSGRSEDSAESITTTYEDEANTQINHVNLMGVILVMHVCIILGFALNLWLTELGLKLPLFVACLMVAIALSNSIPKVLPKAPWPSRTAALSVMSEFSLGLFIAMSLMSMQLWSVAELAGPLLILLGIQAVATVVFILFIFFKIMGSNYMAAVLSAGFAGFSLGATPTAIANMTAVTKSHGAAPLAFIILPLVGAFFVDISNAFIIQFFLNL